MIYLPYASKSILMPVPPAATATIFWNRQGNPYTDDPEEFCRAPVIGAVREGRFGPGTTILVDVSMSHSWLMNCTLTLVELRPWLY